MQRWTVKKVGRSPASKSSLSSRDIIIERDTIVLVKVKIGRGASAATVSHPFRVVNIFDKYYNKWFMSKDNFKKWKKEEKPYKLEVRMLNKNPLNEYADAVLCGHAQFGKKDICKLVGDAMVVSVVGKLKSVA